MVQIFFLHPKGLSCMHPTLETTDHHFKSTNIKLKLEVTTQRVEFSGQQARLVIMHLLMDGLQMTKPCPLVKKKHGTEPNILTLQERIETLWHHSVSAFNVSILIIFQSTTNSQ